MDDPIRVFTTLVLLASASYVVLTNLQFRRQWPAKVAHHRQHLASVISTLDWPYAQKRQLESTLTGVQLDRTIVVVSASVGGTIAGTISGILLNVALVVLSAPPRVDHSFTLGLVGALFGAVAFGVLAAEE